WRDASRERQQTLRVGRRVWLWRARRLHPDRCREIVRETEPPQKGWRLPRASGSARMQNFLKEKMCLCGASSWCTSLRIAEGRQMENGFKRSGFAILQNRH